jgi:protein ImuB
MLWIALHLPDLPAQVFTRGAPEEAACAVFDGHPRPRVVAANTGARARGVHPGEALAAVRAIAPDIELYPRDPALETATLHELASACSGLTPSISLVPPSAVLLEVAACLRLFGGLPHLLEYVRTALDGLGIHAGMAVAPTPLAAHWLAVSRPCVATGADWRERLDALPLKVLGIGSEVSDATLELLTGLGLEHLHEARRLPREGLARRQARSVIDALARARAERADPRAWLQMPARHAATLVLPVATAGIEPLLFAVSRLIAGLVAWLSARHAGIDRFVLELAHEDRRVSSIEIVSSEPSRDAARLMLLAREHLSVLRLPAPVEALRLLARAPVTRPGVTPDLFGHPDEVRENATLLLDRLRARLGNDAIHRIATHADHRPEYATRALPSDARTTPATPVTERPTWLLEPPRRLASLAGLELLAGPERIESGWWDGKDVRRDYFVARAPGNALWWIFQDLDARDWHVHGHFG